MKKFGIISIIIVLAAAGLFICRQMDNATQKSPMPNDYLWAQRSFPYQSVPSNAYYDAIAWAFNQAAARGSGDLNWELAGPTNVSGRITDLAMHESDLQTIYAATASGGVWKSTDAADSWAPISDALPSLSIGDIAIDPSNKNVVYCGTGETNGGGGSVTYDGLGVYKSLDGGNNWQPAGLTATGSIGRIEVDPKRPNRVFVAAMGQLFGNNPERGVYRSNDGGDTWEQVLFVNDSVGAIDLAIHPQNTDTLFAVSWERIRRPNARVYGGPGSAVWRSTDGGDSWTKLSGGLPTGSTVGRMGIAMAPSEPGVLYVTIARTTGSFAGVYRSSDNGDTWALVPGNGNPGYSSFGWWFGQIRVHPENPNHIFNLGVGWKGSSDAGATWAEVSNYLHADYHAFYIHPANPDFQVVGNDGGIYLSTDGGANWEARHIPSTQFYTSEIDFQYPTRFSGGTQDNGTWASIDGSIDNWNHILGGDGFVTLVNPQDNSIFYAESQYGGFSGSNGAKAPPSARYNWNTPYIFDPNNPDILYFGAEKLFKSSDRGLNWTAISSDLSNGNTGSGGVVYGTITTIAASPVDSNIIFAGTDDGNVWVTDNAGSNWTKISDNLPKRWVTRVVADLWDAQTAYICLSGFRHNEAMVHVYKTTDLGQTWQSASGNLPDIPVNDLILDPLDPAQWFLATDAGVFLTTDAGENWLPANQGLPKVPVLDLTFHAPTRSLVAATYGRAIFKASVPTLSALHEPTIFENIRVLPNPTLEDWQLAFTTFETRDIRVELYDLSGRCVQTKRLGSFASGRHSVSIHAGALPAGVYILKMSAAGKGEVCRKLVKAP
jgi:photosystem II stability/assembly factor-like uncharacterized protein